MADLFEKFAVKPVPVEPPKPSSVVRVQPAVPDTSNMSPAQILLQAQKTAVPASQPDQYGVHDVGQTASSRADYGGLQFADDVIRNVADGASFGTADKFAAYMDSILGKGSYDELLAKARQETEEAGGRLGPYGKFLAEAGGGMLTGGGLAKMGLTLLGHVPKTASLLTKMGAAGAEGGLYGAVSGAGHTDTGNIEDYTTNAVKGGLLGAATGVAFPLATAIGSKIITPLPIKDDPVRAKAMQTLEDAGVDVSAGTKTGSPKLRRAEEVISHNPLGGPRPTEEQMAQVTQAVMEKAGITGPRRAATPDVIKDRFQVVGKTIEDLQKPYATPVDDTLLNAVAKVESEVLPRVEQGKEKTLQYFIDKITSGQELKPDMAQSIRTQLLEDIRGASGQHQRGLIDLKNALDDALERAMKADGNEAGVAALNAARNQYAHLHILSDALNRSGAAGMRGELTPSALAAALQKSVGKVGFSKGEGDLNDLARASAGYLQPPRSSGTSENETFWNPARWALGVGGRLAINNPVMQRYLGNQVAGPVSGAVMQPPVAGLVNSTAANPDVQSGVQSGLLGPADRLMRQLRGEP